LLEERERQIIQILWRQGRLSRWELHEQSGQTPNGVGSVIAGLLEQGLLRECRAEPSGGGRPRIPLELDPMRRHMVGVLIGQRAVEVCRLNLYGNLIGREVRREVTRSQNMIVTAARLLENLVDDQTLGIGLGAAGLIDAEAHTILMSSAIPDQRAISLQPIYDAAANCPLVIANDMQALAVRWMLTHRAEITNDVLLVGFVDGSMGAAMLLEGRPNKGCVMACNELGHTRLPVATDQCYCGQTGCLETICSTSFLRRNGLPEGMTLQSALMANTPVPALEKMLELLAMGIANSVNFVRPHRLVLVSNLVRYEAFSVPLMRHIRGMLLSELADRVRIDLWDQPAFQSAETAGWTALASLYTDAWPSTKTNGNQHREKAAVSTEGK
jgi:predicted NBD/HSP70 family sugar kinase